MKLIFITFLGVLSFGIRAVPAAEEETGNSASRQTIAPGSGDALEPASIAFVRYANTTGTFRE